MISKDIYILSGKDLRRMIRDANLYGFNKTDVDPEFIINDVLNKEA